MSIIDQSRLSQKHTTPLLNQTLRITRYRKPDRDCMETYYSSETASYKCWQQWDELERNCDKEWLITCFDVYDALDRQYCRLNDCDIIEVDGPQYH